MKTSTYRYQEDEHERHLILDPEGECCKGCGAPLKAGPEECDYCGRPAVSAAEQGWPEPATPKTPKAQSFMVGGYVQPVQPYAWSGLPLLKGEVLVSAKTLQVIARG